MAGEGDYVYIEDMDVPLAAFPFQEQEPEGYIVFDIILDETGEVVFIAEAWLPGISAGGIDYPVPAELGNSSATLNVRRVIR